MPNHILITGASGFVGTYLRAAIAATLPEARVTGVGAKADMKADIKPDERSREKPIGLDLLDRLATDAFVRETRPDAVIHLAGQASVARAETGEGDLTWAVNVGGAVNLAAAIARHAPEAVVLVASSAEVYGGSFLRSPVSETSALLPMNTYAKSKAVAERVFADMLPATASLVLARPFNHTGAGQREDFVLPSFAAQIARIEAGLQPPRMAVGNLGVVRDFLDVRDVADAYLALLGRARHLPKNFVVNIASGRPRALRDLVDLLKGMARVPFDVEVDPARLRPVDLPVAFAEPTLLRAVTGWTPRIDMEATLASLLEAARAAIR